MLVQENTAILTCMDRNQEENLLNDFLSTLRHTARYQGQILVLDYGMSVEAAAEAEKKYSASIHQCVKDRFIFSVRNRDLARIIEGLPRSITHVMVIDGGDVWFQAPVDEAFELCRSSIGYVESFYTISNNFWTMRLVQLLEPGDADTISRSFRGTRLKNAGMFCGPRDLAAIVANGVYRLTEQSRRDFFGLDQLYFNYLINEMNADKKVVLPETYNYVLIDHKYDFIMKDNRIYDKDHCAVTIVHNAGGTNRIIKKASDSKADTTPYSKVRHT